MLLKYDLPVAAKYLDLKIVAYGHSIANGHLRGPLSSVTCPPMFMYSLLAAVTRQFSALISQLENAIDWVTEY